MIIIAESAWRAEEIITNTFAFNSKFARTHWSAGKIVLAHQEVSI